MSTANYGSGKCPECDNTFQLRKDGTLRHHLGNEMVGRWRQVCKGIGLPPVSKPLGQTFPCTTGSLWRDVEGDLWVLCADGRMRKIDELEQPDSPTELDERFGPLTRVDGAS